MAGSASGYVAYRVKGIRRANGPMPPVWRPSARCCALLCGWGLDPMLWSWVWRVWSWKQSLHGVAPIRKKKFLIVCKIIDSPKHFFLQYGEAVEG